MQRGITAPGEVRSGGVQIGDFMEINWDLMGIHWDLMGIQWDSLGI